jgi:PAS domain S-box-containing protein
MHRSREKGYWESFDDIDGLGHECWCILQDSKSNIWIGTRSGLSRYDGKEFTSFSEKDGLADRNVQCLHQDREGNIWIGTRNGLSRYNGSGFSNFTDEDGLADNYIWCIHQDRNGYIWIGTSNGLSRYDGKGFANFTREDGLAGDRAWSIQQDRDGNIWIGTLRGGLSRYDGSEFTSFTSRDGLPSNNVRCLYQDREGNIWIGTTRGLSRYDGRSSVNFTYQDGLADDNILCIYQDRKGSIWIGIWGGGVCCYDGNDFVNYNTEHGLAHNNVLDIIEDREGSLWFACHHGGVSRYNPYEISHIADEPVSEVIMLDKGGNLRWGSENVLSQFDGNDIKHYSFEHRIYDLLEDSKEQLWIGTDYAGVFVYDSVKDLEGKEPRNFTIDNGLTGNWVVRIYEDAQGNIWLGTSTGLSRYDGSDFTSFTARDGLGSNLISAILQDSSGILWFGGWEGDGITRYDGEKFQRYTTDDGLIDNRVICIVEDDKSNLWIGTSAGVSCYDGKSFSNYTTEDGLSGDFVQRMLQDRRGHIWIATLGGGISRFDGRNFQVLTIENGLPSNNVTGIIEEPDGSVVISTYKGVCKYVPDYKTPPLVHIDEVDADRIYEDPEEIQISESSSSIRIKYHGISFKTKRMRYNYILEGYDKDWIATWAEEVRYENLPVGEYTFRVTAVNRDLVYSEQPAELRLRIDADTRDQVISELEEKVRERTNELKEAKDYIDNVIRSMVDTLIVLNPDGTIRTVNQATLDLLGYDEDELIGQPIEMILAEEKLTEAELDDLIESGFVLSVDREFIRNIENTYVAKDGRKIPVLFSGSAMRDDNGEIQGTVCVAQDITERKWAEEELRKHRDHLEELVQERTEELIKTVERLQKEITERRRAEKALRESEERYRFLYEESPAISFIIDVNGAIRDVNRSLLKELGYSREEIIGRNAMDFIASEQRKKAAEQLEKDFSGEYTSEIDIDVYAKDGSVHTILFSPGQAILYEGDAPSSILVTGIDITERKRAEELARLREQQLIQADKMSTLGILVSGVAHEINNPNNFILLNAKIFSRVWDDVMPILGEYYKNHGDFALAGMLYTQAHEKIGQLISGMSQGSQRIQRIVQGLKDFARQDTGDMDQSVDINSVVEAAVLIVGNLIRKSTNQFSCEYGTSIPKICGNIQQLEQVVINLITNACQALQDMEKCLFISTSHDENSGNVIIEVRDEGIGISQENLKHVMDPFFTTNRSSGGTGLGLSISYNIVKAHGGDLSFTSEPGKGTTVVLTLPALSEKTPN